MLELPPFTLDNAHFQGTLPEALSALRRQTLPPQHVDVLALVRDYLEYYQRYAAENLESASQILPQLAAVIELKTRLLLPQPAKTQEEKEEEVIEILENLEALESAISFLRQRREERSYLLPARVPFSPPKSKKISKSTRSPQKRLQRLLELASRYQSLDFFELTRERITMPMALKVLQEKLQALGRFIFAQVSPQTWADKVVYFSALLEMVKTGQVQARQIEPFCAIEVARATSSKNKRHDEGES